MKCLVYRQNVKYNSTITFTLQIFHSDSYFIFTRYFTRSSEFHWQKHSPKQVLFLNTSNSYSPDRENVTKWQKGDCEERATRTCDRSETLSHYFAFARPALCFFLFSDCFLVHRTRSPAKQLTAACSANWAIEAYSVFSALLGSRTCDRSETLSHYFAFARSALCFFLFSDCFFVHRTRSPAKQLTAVLFLSFG